MATTTYTDWPKRGDTRDQPWTKQRSGVIPRGGLPLLVSGGAVGAEPVGQQLFSALHDLGYETPISRGENPFGVIGPEEMGAVHQFRRDYNVQENPESFGGDDRIAASHIGPYTGEAILRARAALPQPVQFDGDGDGDRGDGDGDGDGDAAKSSSAKSSSAKSKS